MRTQSKPCETCFPPAAGPGVRYTSCLPCAGSAHLANDWFRERAGLRADGSFDKGASGPAQCWRAFRSRDRSRGRRSHVGTPRSGRPSPVPLSTELRVDRRSESTGDSARRHSCREPYKADRAKRTQNLMHPICTLKPSPDDVGARRGDGQTPVLCRHFSCSGASRDRTGDLLLAKQALSQLSYGPWRGPSLTAPEGAGSTLSRRSRSLGEDAARTTAGRDPECPGGTPASPRVRPPRRGSFAAPPRCRIRPSPQGADPGAGC